MPRTPTRTRTRFSLYPKRAHAGALAEPAFLQHLGQPPSGGSGGYRWKTIAMPCSLQASMDSWSRTEPPGWMMAVTPWAARVSTLSRNGKKGRFRRRRRNRASPRRRSQTSSARWQASSAESTRLAGPGPCRCPSRSWRSRPVDLTVLQTFQANIRSRISSSEGTRSVGMVKVAGTLLDRVDALDEHAAVDGAHLDPGVAVGAAGGKDA